LAAISNNVAAMLARTILMSVSRVSVLGTSLTLDLPAIDAGPVTLHRGVNAVSTVLVQLEVTVR